MRQFLLQKSHGTGFAHLRLDAVLGFELLQELVRAERGRQDVGLALHCGEIARAQLLQPRQAREHAARLASEGVHHLDAPVSGGTVGAAKDQVTTSERLDQLPTTAERMRAGDVSSEQAGIVADAATLNPAGPAPTPSSGLLVAAKRPDPPTSGRPAKRPDPPDLSGTIVDPPKPTHPISGLTLPDPPQLGPASGPPSIIVAARRPDPPNLGPASGTLTHPDPPPLAAPASRSLDVTRDSHPPASRNLDLRRDTDSLDSTRPDADDPPLAETRAGSSFTRSATPAHRDLATTAAEQTSDLGATLAAPPVLTYPSSAARSSTRAPYS